MALTTERTPDRTAEAADETADDAHGKYRQPWQWLQDQGRNEIRLTFADIEQVLGHATAPVGSSPPHPLVRL